MAKLWWLVAGLVAVLVGYFIINTISPSPTMGPTTAVTAPTIVSKNAEPKVPESAELLEWHEFQSPNGEFKVDFPTLPQHVNQTLEDPKTKEARQYDMYVSEKGNGTIFMITLIKMLDHPNGKIDEKVLSNIINDLLAVNPQNQLKKIQKSHYKDNAALDFSIENKDVTIDGKAFIVGKTLYVITSAAKNQDYSRQEFDYFMNSFQLSPDNIQAQTPTPGN